MPVPTTPTPFVFKDKVELSIDVFASNAKPTVMDLNRVKVISQVEQMLDKYREEAGSLNADSLEEEKHESAVLAAFLTATAIRAPTSCVMPMPSSRVPTRTLQNFAPCWPG